MKKIIAILALILALAAVFAASSRDQDEEE